MANTDATRLGPDGEVTTRQPHQTAPVNGMAKTYPDRSAKKYS
jgi:hypothetical protein